MALQGHDDTEIGWRLAQVEVVEDARQAWLAKGEKVGATLGPQWEAWWATQFRGALISDPAERVGDRTVQRRIKDGCQRIGVERPADRKGLGRSRQGAIKGAVRAWLEHDALLKHDLHVGRPPDADPELLKLTAECWRAGAAVQARYGAGEGLIAVALAQVARLVAHAEALIAGVAARQRLRREFGTVSERSRARRRSQAHGDPTFWAVVRRLNAQARKTPR